MRFLGHFFNIQRPAHAAILIVKRSKYTSGSATEGGACLDAVVACRLVLTGIKHVAQLTYTSHLPQRSTARARAPCTLELDHSRAQLSMPTLSLLISPALRFFSARYARMEAVSVAIDFAIAVARSVSW